MILIVNDLHFDQRGPVCRDINYLRDITGKLLEISVLSRNAQAVLITGDLIHRRIGKNVSHFTVRVIISLMKKMKCPVWLVLGNHDVMGNQLKTVITQPVGVILEADVMTRLDLEPYLDEDLQVMGYPYTERFEKGLIELRFMKRAPLFILGIHGDLSPGSLLRDKIEGPDIVCVGHPHLDTGITKTNGIYYIEFGSLARITTRPYDARLIRVALLEIKGDKWRVRPYTLKNQRHWSEIYAERAESVEDEVDIEDFVNLVESEDVSSVDQIEELLKTLDLRVRRRVEFYLQSI